MADSVLYAVADGVATVTINRPDAFNAADVTVRTGLRGAVEQAAEDPGVRALVLTGAGRAFCVGQDLKELEPLYATGDPSLASIVTEFNAVVVALAGLAKPTVAAVNGPAAGAGMSLALACDFRFAAEAAHFTTSFSKIGLVPDSGGSWLLPRLVGWAKARELFLLSDRVDAAEALRIGLVTKVVAGDALAADAQAFAASLAAGPTLAYGWIKELLDFATTATLGESLDEENRLQTAAGRTADHLGAVTAFLAKQPPKFEGR